MEIDEFIRKNGSDVKKEVEQGWPLLHRAALLKQLAVIKYLLSKGADINAKNDSGETPLHCALLTIDDRKIDIEIIKYLVSKGANVNAKDYGGGTPLHHAASVANVEVVKFLISKGADVKAKTDDRTALWGNFGSGGSGTSVPSKEGLTPLDVARKANNTAVVEYLSGLK